MGKMTKIKFYACRAAQRDLWDYAGERLAEGPLEQVERHLESCAKCRREAAQYRRAQGLLATAQTNAAPQSARLGWSDLQQRIAADVAQFGEPRPDKAVTRQAVSHLLESRRASRFASLRPTLAGGFALTLTFALFAHRTPKNAPMIAASLAPTVSMAAIAPPVASNPFNLNVSDPLPVQSEIFAGIPTAPRVGPKKAVTTRPTPLNAPQRLASAEPAKTTKTPVVKKPSTAKHAAQATPRKQEIASAPLADKLKFAPRDANTDAEKAPDAAEVANGVIGVLVPVSHDEDNVY